MEEKSYKSWTIPDAFWEAKKTRFRNGSEKKSGHISVNQAVEGNRCLSGRYTGSDEKIQSRGYTPHIRPRGEEKKELERNPDFHARRWVVEVTHSFFNRFRKLLIRYEKKTANYLAQLVDKVVFSERDAARKL